MSDREEILNRLRGQARPVSPPPQWSSNRQYADLAEQFTTALTAVYGEVIHVADLEAALAALAPLWSTLSAQQIIVNDEPALQHIDWSGRWPEIDWFIVDAQKSSAEVRNFSARADVGISSGLAALAETGTVIIASGPGRSRLVTLLPPVHVALVYRHQILPDIFAWVAGREADWPANVVLVSGPSKTADIEQTLSVGVHGPKRFIVVLIES